MRNADIVFCTILVFLVCESTCTGIWYDTPSSCPAQSQGQCFCDTPSQYCPKTALISSTTSAKSISVCASMCTSTPGCAYFELVRTSMTGFPWTSAPCYLYKSCDCSQDQAAGQWFVRKWRQEACPTTAAQANCTATQWWNPSACGGFSNGCTECSTDCNFGTGVNGPGGSYCTATSDIVCVTCPQGLENSQGSGLLCTTLKCGPPNPPFQTPYALPAGTQCSSQQNYGGSCALTCVPGYTISMHTGYESASPAAICSQDHHFDPNFDCNKVLDCTIQDYLSTHPGMHIDTSISCKNLVTVPASAGCNVFCQVPLTLVGSNTITCVGANSTNMNSTFTGNGFCKVPPNPCSINNGGCNTNRSTCVSAELPDFSWTYSCQCFPGYIQYPPNTDCLMEADISIPYGDTSPPGTICTYMDVSGHPGRSIGICNGVGQTNNKFSLTEQYNSGITYLPDLFRGGRTSDVFPFNLHRQQLDLSKNKSSDLFGTGEYVYVDICDPSFVNTDEYGIQSKDPRNNNGETDWVESTSQCQDRVLTGNINFFLYPPTSPFRILFQQRTGQTTTYCWRIPVCYADRDDTPDQFTVYAVGPAYINECVTLSYCSPFIQKGGCVDPSLNTWGDVQCTCDPVHYEGTGVTCEPKRCHTQPTEGVGSLGVAPPCEPYLGGVLSGSFCELACDAGYIPGGDKYQCWEGDWYVVYRGWTDPQPPPDSTAQVFCIDKDECAGNNNPCSRRAVCTNTPGSYSCRCMKGFFGDGTFCDDINECATANGGCHAGASCYNFEGAFSCGCNVGYVGDGTLCNDINECAVDPMSCDKSAKCFNTEGSFRCSCNYGFTGDGFTCTPINQCDKAITGGCDINAQCVNNNTCVCDSGWMGSGLVCYDCRDCAGGEYETTACTATSDRICTPCAKCAPGFHAFVPCGPHQEQLCLEDFGAFEIHNTSGSITFTLPAGDRTAQVTDPLAVEVRYGDYELFDPVRSPRVIVLASPQPGSAALDATINANNLYLTVSTPFSITRQDLNGMPISGRFEKGDYVNVDVFGFHASQDIRLKYLVGTIFLDAEDICNQINNPAPPGLNGGSVGDGGGGGTATLNSTNPVGGGGLGHGGTVIGSPVGPVGPIGRIPPGLVERSSIRTQSNQHSNQQQHQQQHQQHQQQHHLSSQSQQHVSNKAKAKAKQTSLKTRLIRKTAAAANEIGGEHIVEASHIHMHANANHKQAFELPATSAFNLLETNSHMLSSQEHVTGHDHKQRARFRQQHQHQQQHHHQQLQPADQLGQVGQLGDLVVKTFEVCYTRAATTFVFVTPVPDVDNFTCAERLFDHPEFFAALNLGPRQIRCPRGCFEGKIFGTGTYTIDSQVCMAGAHSSTNNGGIFQVNLLHSDITDYPSSTQMVTIDPSDKTHVEDVTSIEWPAPYPTSFLIQHVSW